MEIICFFTIWFTQYATFWRSIYFIGKQNVNNKKADICRVVMLKHFDCKLQLQVFCLHKLCTSASWHFCTVMSKLLDLCQTGWRQLVDSWTFFTVYVLLRWAGCDLCPLAWGSGSSFGEVDLRRIVLYSLGFYQIISGNYLAKDQETLTHTNTKLGIRRFFFILCNALSLYH